MRLCLALVSFTDATHFLYFTSLTKDLSSGNGTSDDTEIFRVASLSATFERQRRFKVSNCCIFVAPDSSATVSKTSGSEGISDRIITAPTSYSGSGGLHASELYIDGNIANMFGQEGATAYFSRLLQVDLRSLRFIPTKEWPSAFLICNPQVPHARPFTITRGNPAWLLDFEIRPIGTVVQQRIWAPVPQNEAQRLPVAHAPLNMPIFFVLNDHVTLGLPIVSAAARDHMTLRGAGTPAPVGECSTTFIRINVRVALMLVARRVLT